MHLLRSEHTEKREQVIDLLSFFSYIRLAASSMHRCVICPSDVVCASRVKSSKANIISLRNEVEQYHCRLRQYHADEVSISLKTFHL